jgi:hypothetical protein
MLEHRNVETSVFSIKDLIKRNIELLRESNIRPEIAFDLAKDSRFLALEDTRHLSDRHLCVRGGPKF